MQASDGNPDEWMFFPFDGCGEVNQFSQSVSQFVTSGLEHHVNDNKQQLRGESGMKRREGMHQVILSGEIN